MAEFGWSSAEISLVGSAVFIAAICNAIIGRVADVVGIRAVAIFGIVAEVLILLCLSFMNGDFLEYAILYVALTVLVAATTTQIVYSRLVVHTFNQARGMALAISGCAPPLAWAFMIPFLSEYINQQGWRSGYRLLAGLVGVGGLLALLLMRTKNIIGATERTEPKISTFPLYSSRAFWLIMLGFALGSLTIIVQTNQLNVLLLRTGLDSTSASLLISAWAMGVVAGILLCGALLDRFPGYMVAACYMTLPGIGLLIIAAGATSPALLLIAVLFMGLTMGAEGNLAGYLISEYFPLEVFSRAIGAAVGALAFSGAFGSVLLGICLKLAGSFTPFLLFAAASAVVGSVMLWKLKWEPRRIQPVATVASTTGMTMGCDAGGD